MFNPTLPAPSHCTSCSTTLGWSARWLKAEATSNSCKNRRPLRTRRMWTSGWERLQQPEVVTAGRDHIYKDSIHYSINIPLRLPLRTHSILNFSLIMSAKCYDQDGNENPDLLACSADGDGLASCCQPGDACATNGFCLPPSAAKAPLNYYVYGCSDPTWNASTCVNECNSMTLTRPGGKTANMAV